jgi:hypothetical protein
MKIRKINLDEMLESLLSLKAEGVEYVDIETERGDFQDVFYIIPGNEKRRYTVEDINQLLEHGS